MANPTDTTTTLSPPSQAGGDAMDESLVTQSDGATQGKRPRVDVGYRSDDLAGRLVSKDLPLPVEMPEMLFLLAQLLEEVKKTNFMLAAALGTDISGGE